MRLASFAAVITALAALAGCSIGGSDDNEMPQLLQFKNDGRPDELATVSTRPLEYPDLSIQLQPPRWDGVNRADRRPEEEVIATLGGSERTGQKAPAAKNRKMIAYSTRYGIDPMIKQKLESEDLAYRRKNDGRLLERVFSVNVYFDAYRPMSIDPYVELERLRGLNVRTPSAPPGKDAQ